MFSSSSKPYTAVTVQIERLTGPEYEENDYSGIVDLIEVIRIQDSGPTEAARALRKKLKYGNSFRQLRALTILNGLIENAGTRFQRTFADEPLLERLRMMPRDEVLDPDVRAKCNQLYKQWGVDYKNVPGMGGIASLHKQVPTRSRPQPSQSKVIRETERDAAADPFGEAEEISDEPVPEPARRRSVVPGSPTPGSSKPLSSKAGNLSSAPIFAGTFAGTYQEKAAKKDKKDKKGKPQVFSLEKEKGKMLQTIAQANVASTNLLNALQLVNRETTQVSDDLETAKRFETCKLLRRQILRYIQLVESDQWIGSLLSANDELVKALMAYEIMDKSIDDDSDSEAEGTRSNAPAPSARRASKMADSMAAMSVEEQPPAKPPRPQSGLQKPPAFTHRPAPPPIKKKPVEPKNKSEEDEDDDDPFGDRNALKA